MHSSLRGINYCATYLLDTSVFHKVPSLLGRITDLYSVVEFFANVVHSKFQSQHITVYGTGIISSMSHKMLLKVVKILLDGVMPESTVIMNHSNLYTR